MLPGGEKVHSVDEYINLYPLTIRKKLKQLRNIILESAPECEEGISYQMPVYKQNGVLVYFGAFKNHIGFFPTASGINEFKKEISKFECSKGTIRFPHDNPIPIALVKKIVKFRVKQNLIKVKKR